MQLHRDHSRYILRVVGKILMGPVQDKHHETLTDAVWYEKVAAFGLIAAIAAIGMAPLWLSNMIGGGIENIAKLFTYGL